MSGFARRVSARRVAAGWSLAEVVFAGGVLSVMLAASAAVIAVATRPLASLAGEPAELVSADFQRICDAIAAELRLATEIVEANGEAIRVLVRDPGGSGSREIEFRFLAGDGGRLLRAVDGGTPAVLAAGIKGAYFETMTDEREGTPRYAFDAQATTLAASAAGTKGELGVTLLSGGAVTVQPALPTGARAWEVSGLRVRARRGASPSNRVVVELRTPVGLLPGGTVLASASVEGQAAPVAMGWMTIALPPTVVPASLDAVSVSFRTASVLAPMILETASEPQARDWDASYTGTLGAWLPLLGSSLTYELLGRIELPATPIERRVVAIRFEVAPTADGVDPIERIIALPISALDSGASS